MVKNLTPTHKVSNTKHYVMNEFRFVYSVEMFGKWDEDAEPYWREDTRIYHAEKKLTDFDLHDIEGKRRNAKFLYKQNQSFVNINP